jgi:UDP-galactopyranose mutase
MKNKALIIGSGLSGSTAAYLLSKNGWDVSVYEKEYRVGGHVKTATLGGVMYEEYAIHVNHTDNDEVIELIKEVADWHEYIHIVKTVINGKVLSWPPQIEELKETEYWEQIELELGSLSNSPDYTNFETYAISIMGKTLYSLFIYDYTLKQWGADPKTLSSSFAPKRIDLRYDGDRRMFRDKWQAFPTNGWSSVIDNMLTKYPVNILMGKELKERDVEWENFDVVIVTAALDEFLDRDELSWRGVRVEHQFIPLKDDTMLPAAQVNYPGKDKPYTRMTETKWKSGQKDKVLGTVVTTEYPGANFKHYPVDDMFGENRKYANSLKKFLLDKHSNAIIAGRLANYIYINTDQAIMQGINAAKSAMSKVKEK